MLLLIISGPSGSGKMTLSKIILKKLKNGIILNTDNYYRTGIISQILSKTVVCYFDRKISFNHRLFNQDLESIIKQRFSNFSYEYNFKRKSIKKTILNKTKNIKFVIVEGIFGLEIKKSFLTKNCILINLKTNLYDITYGATGDEKLKGIWKYLGIGYGFGTDELVCSYCNEHMFKGFAMQYILIFDYSVKKSFSIKASIHQKTSKIRHKYKTVKDDLSSTVINIGIGF